MTDEGKERSVGVRDALGKRAEIVHVALIAAFLAFGVSLLASYTFSNLNHGSSPLWIGAFLVFIAAAYLILVLLRARRTSDVFEGVILVRQEDQRTSVIRGYGLTEEVSRTLDAAFVENEALELAWKSEPPACKVHPNESNDIHDEEENLDREGGSDIGTASKTSEPSYWSIVKTNVSESEMPSKPPAIMTEVLEFVVLEQLSLHLSEYFGDFVDRDQQVVEYNRSHIPQLLLDNRILSLLSTPIEDRAIFAKSVTPEPAKGTIHAIYGSDGSMYSRFDLFLPKGARIRRPEPGVLQLDNKRATLTIAVLFEGFNANLPRGFSEAYLGVDRQSVRPFQVKILLTTIVKTGALFRNSGWKYYEWIDSFSERLREFSEFDSFLVKIGWEAAATSLRVAENLRRRRSSAKA